MAKKSGSFPVIHSSDTSPFIYFDLAIAHGTIGGAIQIELASRTLVPVKDGSTKVEFVVTGRLRCSANAIHSLRLAIDKALELLRQAQGQPGEGGPTSSGMLN
jgi:hypothetical protein